MTFVERMGTSLCCIEHHPAADELVPQQMRNGISIQKTAVSTISISCGLVLLTQSILCVVVLAIKCVMVRIAYSLYWVLHEHESPLLSDELQIAQMQMYAYPLNGE